MFTRIGERKSVACYFLLIRLIIYSLRVSTNNYVYKKIDLDLFELIGK